MNKLKLNLSDVGCYVAGHWGKYATTRMVLLAADQFDFELTDAQRTLLDKDMRGDSEEYDFEDIIDLADRAEAWLNENSPADLVWHWQDGEFFLSRVDEDADED